MLQITWAAAALLAIAYLFFGGQKLFSPDPEMPRGLSLFLGVAEVAGAVGVVLPELTGIAAVLTPIAAFALALLQVLAFGFHLSRKEYKVLPLNTILLVLALFVGLSWTLWI